MSRKSRAVLIEAMESRLFLDASQLTVLLDPGSLPASHSDHAALTGNASITVTNNSGVTQKEKVVVSVLIARGTLDVAGRNFAVLKSINTNISLIDGKSQPFKFSINIAAGKIADGTFTLYGFVVDPTNAYAASLPGPSLTIRPPIITLAETENILKLPDSTTAGSNVSVTDQVTITNSGSDPSTDPLKIGLYATPDGIPAHGKLVTGVTRKVTINPGKPQPVSFTIGGIPALAVGTYKLVTQVTQADGTITTTDPSTAPTITVTTPTSGVHFNPTINTDTPAYTYEPLDGALVFMSSLTMQMSIKNTGTAASGEDQFSLFASTSPTFDSSAVQIGGPLSLDLGSIPHNGLRIFNIQFNTIDLNDFSGNELDRYIFVQVTDPTGNVTMASLGKLLKVAGPPV
jgi:hypothetical protein